MPNIARGAESPRSEWTSDRQIVPQEKEEEEEYSSKGGNSLQFIGYEPEDWTRDSDKELMESSYAFQQRVKTGGGRTEEKKPCEGKTRTNCELSRESLD